MTLTNALALIRARINDEFDTGYSDEVLVDYINNAIKYLSGALITRNDPTLTKEMTISAVESNPIPANFSRLAGGYPIKRVGSSWYVTDDSQLVSIKYFYYPEDISTDSTDLPFEDNDVFTHIIINLACIYALNQHEFNVEQDKSLREELEQVIVSALGEVK